MGAIRDTERLLVYQVEVDTESDAASRDEALKQLCDQIMPAERASDSQREILILYVRRGRTPDVKTDVVLAMDVLANSHNLLKELLSAARVRKYAGSGRSDYRYRSELGLWHARITVEEGRTVPVQDFASLLEL